MLASHIVCMDSPRAVQQQYKCTLNNAVQISAISCVRQTWSRFRSMWNEGAWPLSVPSSPKQYACQASAVSSMSRSLRTRFALVMSGSSRCQSAP